MSALTWAEVAPIMRAAGTVEGEARIHQKFAHLRIRGEWFRAEEELLEFAVCCRLAEESRLAGAHA